MVKLRDTVENEKKKFLCYWGDGHWFHGIRIVNEGFFNVNVGYRENEIKEILKLDIGKVWQSNMNPEEHYVLRIKDVPILLDTQFRFDYKD
jgi:hypothetical protein